MHKQCLIFNLLCLFQVKNNTLQIETQDIYKSYFQYGPKHIYKYSNIDGIPYAYGEKIKMFIADKYYKDNDGFVINEPYYPINDEKNMSILKKYQDMSKYIENVIFGGRLAEYKYYDMDKVIKSAMNHFNEYIKKVEN